MESLYFHIMLIQSIKQTAIVMVFILLSFGKLQAQTDLPILRPVEDERLQKYTYNKIYSAKNGKLFLGTTSGLLCYDGINLRKYSHIDGDTNSLSGNNITNIAEDEKGNLYVSTLSNGINYLDVKKDKFIHLSIFNNGPEWLVKLWGEELLNANVYIDDDQNIWIGGGQFGGLYYSKAGTKKYKKIELDSKEPWLLTVLDIKQDLTTKDKLWLATNRGIFSVNRKTFSISKNFTAGNLTDSLQKGVSITKLDIRNDGSLWFGTSGLGMGRYEIARGRYYLFKSHKFIFSKKIDISSFIKRNDTEYYVTLRNSSVFIFNIDTKKYAPLPDYFLSRNGTFYNYFITTNTRVLIPLPDLFHSTELKESEEITDDRFGNIWCIINKRLFVTYANRKHFMTIKIRDYLDKDSTPILLQDIKWNPVKKFYHAIFKTENTDGVFFNGINLDSNLRLIKSVSLRETGNTSITLDSTNQLEDYATITSFNLSNYSYESNYNSKNGTQLIIQNDLKSGKFKKIIIPLSIKADIYPYYDIDDHGYLWIATSQGVFAYEPRNLKRIYSYEKKNRLPVKQLINITGKGVMCIMSEEGIKLYDYINDRSVDIPVTEELLSNRYNIGGYANNLLFVSFPGYLQYVPIDSLLNQKENRICYLSELLVTDENNSLKSEPTSVENIGLKHYQNDITFSISTTEFYQPQRLQYRYMLERSDNDWSYSDFNNRNISYKNLAPGTYTYRAGIKSSDGTWSKNELKHIITIHPAFWQTSWFKILGAAAILGLITLFFYYRLRLIRTQQQKRAEQEKELLELEAKALRAQMNPHFIFNCMNSIKSLIQQHEEEKSVNYLTTFSKLIRTLFNNADKKEISLYDEMETCKHYLQLEAMRFDTKFSYEVKVDENLDMKSVTLPALIIQPFIENAIWHGIVPKGTGGHIELSVMQNGSKIEIVIDDDGIGREASKQNKSASGLTHQSKGVNLTQSRLELDNLLRQRQAQLEITDKKDEQGLATGTKVIITINEELS